MKKIINESLVAIRKSHTLVNIYKTKIKLNLKERKGITLIALVITIVLNCCGAAMV